MKSINYIKQLKRYLIMFSAVLLLNGCNDSQDKVIDEQKIELESIINERDSLKEKNDELLTKISEADKKALKLEEQLQDLSSDNQMLNNKIEQFSELNDEDLKLIKFFRGYDVDMLTSDYQPSNQLASLDTETGLRILPNISAPFIGYNGVTFEATPRTSDYVMVHAFFNSKSSEGWAFISLDYFTSGFVLADDLKPYISEKKPSYEPKEQFRDFKIGITADEVQNHFDWNTKLIKDRHGFLFVIRYEETLDFWYEPNERRISVINTNNPDYPLESGFKVGDKSEDVFAYYDQHYKLCEHFNSKSFRRYDIGNGYSLDFGVSDDGIINFIMINGGLYAYA